MDICGDHRSFVGRAIGLHEHLSAPLHRLKVGLRGCQTRAVAPGPSQVPK